MLTTPAHFTHLASSAKSWASDHRAGSPLTAQSAASLWETIASLAAACADLTERIEAQENRRVGRPPGKKNKILSEFNGRPSA